MNKHTGYVVIAFLLGVIATQYFLRPSHTESKDLVPIQSPVVENGDESTEPRPKNTLQTLTVRRLPKVATLEASATIPQTAQTIAPTLAPQDLIPIPQPKKRIVELTLDEQNIRELEQNLNDLTNKVVMRREDRGWRVNYLTTNNPMSRVGLQNNDLVLYDLIDSAKSNPGTGPLISRLEGIFSSLQR
ncbi:MAG: hypothetical protein H7235_02335 [Bdellovibrionaceae bacterium]|nr:hypothetical protein [Pseudobdellovibrionaceae bacterium]